MIKIITINNSNNAMYIKIPDIADTINDRIKENNIDEKNIINIQIESKSKALIIYKI